MNKKILKAIDTCHDCVYCKKFEAVSDNYTTALICNFASDTDNKNIPAFLLELSTSRGSTSLPIPDNCPLEDYTQTATTP
jgi:hypothetical protein